MVQPIVIVVIVVIGGIVFVLYKILSKRTTITVSTKSITIPVNTTATFNSELWYKPWFTKKRTQGTVKAKVAQLGASIAGVSPADAHTSHTSSATFTVSGISAGTTKVYVNGTSRHGEHNTVEIDIKVTGGF